MTRVSLKEAYDNKDVVAQIYAIRDTAESAEDSAEQAVTTANTASEHVDALVPQVEGAVQNANSASASAQASAQTVAGYENRLGAVEGDVVQLNTDVDGVESDLNAVTLRVTTAEGQIVTIQGRVTALETADGQNVKLTGEHAIGNYAVLLTDNQAIHGIKTFLGELIRQGANSPAIYIDNLSVSRAERPESTQQCWLQCRDRDFNTFGMIQFVMLENGYRVCQVTMFDKNGGQHVKNILTIDENGNVIS